MRAKRISSSEEPSFFILSTHSFTNGCYSSLIMSTTHIHQFTHTPSLLHILLCTFPYKILKLIELLSQMRRIPSVANLFLQFLVTATIIRIPSLHHLSQGYAQRPHVTLLLNQFRSHVAQPTPRRLRTNGTHFQFTVTQFDHTLLRKEQIARFDALFHHLPPLHSPHGSALCYEERSSRLGSNSQSPSIPSKASNSFVSGM